MTIIMINENINDDDDMILCVPVGTTRKQLDEDKKLKKKNEPTKKTAN